MLPKKPKGVPYTGWRVVESREEGLLKSAYRAAARAENPQSRSPLLKKKGEGGCEGGEESQVKRILSDPLTAALAGFEKALLARASEKVGQSREAALFLHTKGATSPAHCSRTANVNREVGESAERQCTVLASKEYIQAKALANKLLGR